MDILFDRTKETLAAARATYGNQNQLMVAIGELCELASELTKYPRYSTHEKAVVELRSDILKECADVYNVLDHIQAIFGLTDEEIIETAAEKMDRVQGWLNKSNSLEISTVEREVPHEPCPLCLYKGADPFALPCFACKTQPGYPGFTLKRN